MREEAPKPLRTAGEASEDDARRLRRLHGVAHLMDDAFKIPILGIRIGLDPLLGFLPGAGDVLGATFSGWMVITAARMGASPTVILRMLLNLGVDALLGAVPLLGDLFDWTFKANRRNLRIVEAHLQDPEANRRQSVLVVAGSVLGVLALLAALAGIVGWVASAVLGIVTG